jgi:hypothetical protein
MAPNLAALSVPMITSPLRRRPQFRLDPECLDRLISKRAQNGRFRFAGNAMCNNPLCDIEHDCAAPSEERAASEDGVPDSSAAPPTRLRRFAREIATGFGVILAFTAIMAGVTALQLWHVLPPTLHPPG